MQNPVHTTLPNPPLGSGPLDAVLLLAAEVRRVAALARALAEADRHVSLAGLENVVGVLCAKALDLLPHEVAPVRAQLLLLVPEMDRLAALIGSNQARRSGVLPV